MIFSLLSVLTSVFIVAITYANKLASKVTAFANHILSYNSLGQVQILHYFESLGLG